MVELRLPQGLVPNERILDRHHADYNAQRVAWKGVDHSPELIVQPRDADEVARVVDFARDNAVPLAVRNTGHDIAGRSVPDGGLLLSTSGFSDIAVDPQRQQVTVGGGVRWGDLVDQAAAHGLATTGASIASVGVSGFSLHGGFGWLMRSFGLACDNVIGLELVTADGKRRTVTEDSAPELLWAMRGAGSNFGVVTSLTLRLYPVQSVFAGVISYPASQGRDLLHAYRDITSKAPDELVTHFYYLGDAENTHSVALGLCFRGSRTQLADILAPLRVLGDPVHDSVRELDPRGLQAVHQDNTPVGAKYHTRARFLPELTDQMIETLLEHCARITAPLTQVFLEHLGGAVARVPADATAFQGRDAAYSLLAVAGWNGPEKAEEHVSWVRALEESIRPFATSGGYVNYLDDDEDHRIPDAYGAAYQRLVDLKRQLDPTNLFRANRNILPDGDHAAGR